MNRVQETDIKDIWFVHTHHLATREFVGWQFVRSVVPNRSIVFTPVYDRLKRISWRVGDGLERWAGRYYGSNWARTLPVWTEAKILSRLPWRKEPYPVHFLFGEFLSPKDVRPYHKRGARVLVTVHATPWRWNRVWSRPDGYANADLVVVTSNSQKVKVLEHVPEERIVRIRQGFRADEWTPALNRGKRGGRLRLFMFGNTDRDHEFAAKVAAKLPKEKFELRVRTGSPVQSLFSDCPCVTLLPYLSDTDIHEEYRRADLMFMPMKDSAFNTVMLNAMGCGTPVMTNRVGGVPEYVSEDCNVIVSNERRVDEWMEKLLWLVDRRDWLEGVRPQTRLWAETFDWSVVKEDNLAAYRKVAGMG